MDQKDVLGVEEGLLVGRKGAGEMGRGRDADQWLQRQGVAKQATGGEDWISCEPLPAAAPRLRWF